MRNLSQKENQGWQMLNQKRQKIFQMANWLNASIVKWSLNCTIVGIYKQNIPIAMKLVTLQRPVIKMLPPERAPKILLYTPGVYFFLLAKYHLQYLRHLLLKPNHWTYQLRGSLLTLEPQTSFLPTVHIFLPMKNITMNFKQAQGKYFQRIDPVIIYCV